MTPDERKKLEEELRLIEEANAQDSAEHARDLETLNTIDTSTSQKTQYTSLPSPGFLAGWNEDHSIDARQSGAYRDVKNSEEALKENQEKIDQDDSTVGNMLDKYDDTTDYIRGTAENFVGRIPEGALTTTALTGWTALEGANYVRNSYKDEKLKGQSNALAPNYEKMTGEGLEKTKSNPVSGMDDFKKKLAKAGIDYEELKKRPGSMAEKLNAEYTERLAKKYPSWGQRTLTGSAYRKMTSADASPTRNALLKSGVKGLGVAAAIPGVVGLADSFSTASEIEKAEEERPALMEQSKQFQREYKSVELDFVNEWFSKHKPNDVPPGVFEKRLATRALLQAQIEELSR
jgi:hypothetical protein